MKLKYFLLCLPLLFSVTVFADNKHTFDPYDDIYMKDGTVYHGYISSQKMNGDITIHYVSVIRTLEGASVFSEGDGKGVVMTGDRRYSDVDILEYGDMVTFRDEFESDEHTHISQIEKTVRPILKGFLDIITTKNDKYQGNIVETVPGKSVKMLRQNGTVAVILQKNIVSQQRAVLDKTLGIVSQSPFIDSYLLKDGNTVSGVLTSQDSSSGLLIVTDASDNNRPCDIKNISVINKVFRDGFTVVSPGLDKNVLRLNGIEYEGIEGTLKNNAVFFPSNEHLPWFVMSPGSLTVEMDADLAKDVIDQSSPYSLTEFNPGKSDDNDLYRLNGIKNKGKTIIAPDFGDKKGQVATYVYDNLGSGIYALFNIKTHVVFFIWVK